MARLRDRRGKERKEKGERRVRSASIRFIIRAHHPIRNDRRGGRKRDREREEKVFLLFLSFFFFSLRAMESRMYRSRLAGKNAWWRRRDSTRNTYIPRRGSPRPTR